MPVTMRKLDYFKYVFISVLNNNFHHTLIKRQICFVML